MPYCELIQVQRIDSGIDTTLLSLVVLDVNVTFVIVYFYFEYLWLPDCLQIFNLPNMRILKYYFKYQTQSCVHKITIQKSGPLISLCNCTFICIYSLQILKLRGVCPFACGTNSFFKLWWVVISNQMSDFLGPRTKIILLWKYICVIGSSTSINLSLIHTRSWYFQYQK